MATLHSTWFGPPTPPPSSPNYSTPSPIKYRSEERGMLRGLLGRDRDITERQRLDTLHQLHMTLLDPVHTQTIYNHLAAIHATGRRSRVLDVGAGTGAWSVTIANAQPYCDVVAIDIDWSCWSNAATQYGNLDCQTVNVTMPLSFPAHHFDVIHVKQLLLEVPAYTTIIERLAVTLRPGGLMVMVEVEPRYLSAAGETSQTLRTWDACVRDSYAARNVDTTLPANLLHCLSSSGIFQPTAFTQEFGIGSGGFIRGDSQALARAGRLHKTMIEANLSRMLPVVRANGYDEGEIQTVVRGAIAELSSGDSRHYQRIFAVYGRKIGG